MEVDNNENQIINNDEQVQKQEQNTSSDSDKKELEGIKNPDQYYRLLDEKKKLQQQYEETQRKLKEKETAELESQNKYKELYETVRQELDTTKETIAQQAKREENNKKLAYVTQELKKLGAKEERIPKLLKDVDPERIKYDEEHNIFYGHEDEAARIKSEWPEIFIANKSRTDQDNYDLKTTGESYDSFRDIPFEKRKNKDFMRSWYESKGMSVRR